MADFGVSYFIKALSSVITLILLVIIYSYLHNLENKGCACALTKNFSFIKGFTIFAIIYLLFTAMIPDEALYNTFGSTIVLVNKYVDLIFVLVFIYYLYEVFKYTRYLVNEKCKCSVDSRREIIMIGTMIEFFLVFVLFLLHIIIFVIFSTFFNVVSSVNNSVDEVHSIIRDPISSIARVPSKLSSSVREISDDLEKTVREIGRVGSVRTR
jgi:hypothetical protein